MAVSEAANPVEITAMARLLVGDVREELSVLLRDIFERDAQHAQRLAYSPDEAANLLGISRELIHDLLRTGQLRLEQEQRCDEERGESRRRAPQCR